MMRCIAREWAVLLFIAAFLGLPIPASAAAPGVKPAPPRLVWRQQLAAAPATPLGLLATRSVLCIPLRLSGDPQYLTSEHPPVYETLLVDRRKRKPLYRLSGYPIYFDEARVVVWMPSVPVVAPEAKPETTVSHASAASPASSLICYDLPTGKRRWECVAPAGMDCFSATRVGDALCCPFAPSQAQTLRLVRLDNGATLAERTLPDGWSVGPPAFDGKAIYYGVSHALMALDPRTLASRWTTYDGGNANLQIVGGVLITFGWSNQVQGIDPPTGRILWSRYAPREQGSCVVPGTTPPALCLEAYGLENEPSIQRLSRVDVQTGKTRWTRSMDGYKPVAAAAGHVYVAGAPLSSGPGGFASLDAATGAVRWRYDKPGLVGISMLAEDREVIGLGSDCCLYGFGQVQ